MAGDKRGPKRSDKIERIKASATEQFSRYGYKKTSIDNIIRDAQVSKGLFYYYYSDKKDLYLKLYDEYCELVSRGVNEKVDTHETDFLKRMLQITTLKIELLRQYPSIFLFLSKAYYETDPDLVNEIGEKNQAMIEASTSSALSSIDHSLFSETADLDKSINLVVWVAEGFVKQVSEQSESLDPAAFEEFRDYLELVRTGIYRKEPLS